LATVDKRGVDDLVSSTERLLEELGDPDRLTADVPGEAEPASRAAAQAEAMEYIDRSLGLVVDGRVEIEISDDDMVCKAGFYPPVAGGNPLEPDQVVRILQAQDVQYGIDQEAIKDAVFRCNTEGIGITGVEVARGTKPVEQVSEHILLNKELAQAAPAPEPGDQRVEYRERSPYTLVKKGTVLAILRPARKGEMGFTIKGLAIPYLQRRIRRLKPGQNVEQQEERFVAACDGRFAYDHYSFWVSEVLEVLGDVDYRTGNIEFPGDVMIHGVVKDGFRIVAGGSVLCQQTLDASEVECKKDLIIRQGIIGRKKGTVKVGGRIEAKFIENAYVEAAGPIQIEAGILHSAIHTQDTITTGRKGIIVGGTLWAQKGVTAAQLGTSMGVSTEVRVGIDYAVQRRLEWIRDRNIELAMKLRSVERRLQADTAGREPLLAARDKLKSYMSKLNEAAMTLVSHLDKNEEATVVVTGMVYPGCYIEICHIPFVVRSMMSGVSFQLDKSKGKVTVAHH
jgi:uncharacterized protein (DUF342 family)